MLNFFFSDKNSFNDTTASNFDIADAFPIIGVSSDSGIFFHRDDSSVGCIVSLQNCKKVDISKAGKTISLWLNSSPLISDRVSFTVSIHKKMSQIDEAESEEISLRAKAIISISVSQYTKFNASKDKSRKEPSLPSNPSDLTLLNCHLLLAAIDEILPLLKNEGLGVRVIQASVEALDLVREFWTESKTHNNSHTDSPLLYFAKDLNIVPSRIFWKDSNALRMMFGLRVPSPELCLVRGKISVDEFIANLFSVEDILLPGVTIYTLSAGSLFSRKMSDSVAGTLKFGRNSLGSDQEQSVNGEKSKMRASVSYIASLPWAESIGEHFGSYYEAEALSLIETSLINDLTRSTNGGEWHLIDSLWVEGLYASVPGASRLDKIEIQKIFDVIHLF